MEQVKSEKKLKICYIPYYGYEIDNLAFSDKYKRRWTNVLKEKLEKDGHSFATYDINTIKDSDYIISFDNTYFQNVRHFWNILKARKLGRTLHIDYEPPSAMIRIHSDKGLKILSKLFTVMTYNDNVINGTSIVKGVVGDYYEKERPYKKDFDKRKLLCMVANNRNRKDKIPIKKWPSELYSTREVTATYFCNKHDRDFDLYGDFWSDNVKSKGVLKRDEKLEKMSKYKFVISYDSITNQNGYISEKIFDVFAAKSIPIYWGADNVTDYIPKECFIDRRDFLNNEDLFRYIKNMTKKEYELRIGFIEKYLKSDMYKATFSSEAIANNIIQNFIYKKPRRINYFIATLVLLWFTHIYRTNKYYSYDNYFFDVSSKALKYPISSVDKKVRNGGPVFVITANIGKGQSVWVAKGDRHPSKVKLIKISSNGMYDMVCFDVPYENIVESNRVSIFIKGSSGLVPAKINQPEVINGTNYYETTGFKVNGNRILYIKRSKLDLKKLKSLLDSYRILIKKLYKPEIVYYPFIADPAIANDSPFDLKNGNHSWEQQLKILANAQGIAVHTPDKAKFKNVIGVLFFDNMYYHNLTALKDLHQKNLLDKTIYIDFEPPTGHAKKHEKETIKKLSQLFKYVATYDDSLAKEDNFIKCNVANFYAEQSKRIEFSKKKFAVMVTNNTTTDMIIHSLNYWNNTDYYNNKNITYHQKAIYHKRLEIVDYFYKNHSEKLDLYGTGFPEHYNNINKGFLERQKKISTLSQYKFTIAFDSYTHQKGYISEKIFDAFFAKTLPIYLGADNIAEYIPKECFVDMRDFASYEALYEYLSKMSRKQYERRIEAIEDFLKSDKFNMVFSSEAVARELFNSIMSSTRASYNPLIAKEIIDELEHEKSLLSTDKITMRRIDKERVGKQWRFVISIKPPKSESQSLTGRIYGVVNGKKIRVKTFDDQRPELRGNTCVVVTYKEIYRKRKIQYFVDLGSTGITELTFPPRIKKLIDETSYDARNAFYVNQNIIGCREDHGN